MRIEDAAAKLAVSTRTIYRWLPLLPHQIKPRDAPPIYAVDLDDQTIEMVISKLAGRKATPKKIKEILED